MSGNFHNACYDNHQSGLKVTYLGIVDNINRNGGLIKSKFGMVLDVRSRHYVHYYTHHPPLFIVSLYLFEKIFGKELTYVFPLLISLSIILNIYFLISKYSNPFVGFWSAFLVGMHPIFTRYSVFYNFDPLVLLLNIIVLVLMSQIFFENNFKRVILILCLVLSMLADWPGYIACLYVCLCYFLIKKKNKWNRFSLTLLLLPFIMFAIFLFHTKILTGSFNGGNMYGTFIGRISNKGEIGYGGEFNGDVPDYKNYFEFLIWFKNNLFDNFSRLSLIGTCIFLVLIMLNLRNIKKIFKTEIRIFLIGLCFVGFLYLLIFNSFTYYHDFALLHIIPIFAISTVLLIYYLSHVLWYEILNKVQIESNIQRDLFACLTFNILLFLCWRIFLFVK